MDIETLDGPGGDAIAEPLQRWPDSGRATVACSEQLHGVWQAQPIQGDALPSRSPLAGDGRRGRWVVRRHARVDGGLEQAHEAFLLPTGCVCPASRCVAGALCTTVRRGPGTMCSYAGATHSAVPRCGSNVTRTFSAVGCRGSRRAMTASWLPLGGAITRCPGPLAGLLETRHHTRGGAEPAGCFSRTLSASLQLCRKCTDSPLWRARVCGREEANFDHSCFQPLAQHGGEYGQFGQQWAMVYLVKGFDNLLPLSTTHSLTPQRS
jgi:hypothetical protein